MKNMEEKIQELEIRISRLKEQINNSKDEEEKDKLFEILYLLECEYYENI